MIVDAALADRNVPRFEAPTFANETPGLPDKRHYTLYPAFP
jgi:hypothetical protein